ncbi:MAG: phospholipid carrier-dependent glycosyltransferase [Chthoniobacter sp.]|nr:phospholipid carrier-dependent glycosyltransferase [Chthoniobacter sp.]
MSEVAPGGEPAGRTWAALALWSLVLFVAALLVDTRHNQFPYFYHPDEAVKVEQVRTGNWNYHHPMLLLTTTKLAVDLGGVPLQEQRIVEAGRWVSATFTALAVVALSLLAFAWRGWAAAIAAGLALLLHHQFFELAHYLKEDTALVFGVALSFLAAFLFAQKTSVTRAALLGAAVACAISGKYIGLAVLVVVLPVLWHAPLAGRTRRLGAFAVALAVVLLLINLPMIMNPAAFAHSFNREMQLVVHGQQGTTRRVPHSLYLNIFRDNTTPVIWVLLLVFLAKRWNERRSMKRVEWLLIAFPFVYTLALSFSPKSNDRYFLPATAMFTVFAAIGALDAGQLLRRWLPERLGTIAVIVALVAAQAPSWLRYETAFQHDDNREFLDWVRTQLPATAVIVKDSRVMLPDPDNTRDATRFEPLPQTIIARKYAADLGTIEELRKKGITHVAISESDYGGFLLSGVHPKKGEAADFERRKAFYTELRRDGELLFERERGTVLYLHPGIRLYALPPAG